MTKQNLLKGLKYLVCLTYSFISAMYTAGFLNLAFHFSHGIANNPDGVVGIPIGVLALLAFIAIDIVIVVKIVKSKAMVKPEKILFLWLFLLEKFLGFMVDQDGWANFWHYFSYRFGIIK